MSPTLVAQIQAQRCSPEQAAARVLALVPPGPVDPVRLAQALGATVGTVAAPEVSQAVLEIGREGNAWLGTQSGTAPAAARFAVAHLMGHWLLGHGAWKDRAEHFTAACRNHHERQANEFAAAILLPKDQVLALVHHSALLVDEMAVQFGASRALMEYRLKLLGIV